MGWFGETLAIAGEWIGQRLAGGGRGDAYKR